MAKFCEKCGKEVPDNASFCDNCGNQFGGSNNNAQVNININNSTNNGPLVQQRSIVTCIILTIVTCGIYGIYWFITMTDDANKVSGDFKTSGGTAFLFNLLTCSIYGIYWYWKQGQKLYQAGQKHGIDIKDNSILYLILGLIGFGIVSECLIQNDLNKFGQL